MILTVQNKNGKPVELHEYFNIEFEGMYCSKLKEGHPFFHSDKIDEKQFQKKLKLLEEL